MTQWKVAVTGRPGVERDGHQVGRERAHHAEVGVGDVEASSGEATTHLTEVRTG